MSLIALVRHGETDWNVEGRMQGRSDIALSGAGIAQLMDLCTPSRLDGARWLTSPLRRARQTAAILHGEAGVEPRLIEADWGAWEGLTNTAVAPMAARMTARGHGGLDLKPPGGESPRAVRARLAALFSDLGQSAETFVCVTHKGLIRAALSLCDGWDMTAKHPTKLKWRAAHIFEADGHGRVRMIAPNVMLEARR